MEHQVHIWGWVGGKAWTGILGDEIWFLLALRKGCLLLMPSTKGLLHMQKPLLVNAQCEPPRMGYFGSTVQHLGVPCGWGLC